MERKERYIKEQLKNHESDLDVKGLWGELEHSLDKQDKKDRKGFWMFLMPIVLLIGAAWIAYPYIASNNIISPEHYEINDSSAKVLSKSNIVESEIENTTKDIIENHDKKGGQLNSSELVIKNTPSAIDEKVILKKNRSTTSPNILAIDDSNNQFNKAIRKGISTIDRRTEISKSITKTNRNFDTKVTENLQNPIEKNVIASPTKAIKNKVAILEGSDESTYDIAPLFQDEKSIDSVEQLRNSKVPEHLDILKIGLLKLMAERKLPTKEIALHQGNKWSVGLTGGTIFTKVSHTSARGNDDAHFKFANKVRQSQKVAPGEIYTLSLKRKLDITRLENTRHSIGIRTGMSLIKNSYIFEGFRTYNTMTTGPGTTTVIENVDGSLEIIIGEVTTTTTYLYKEKRYNSFESFQIPLMLDYNIEVLPRFSIGLNNGLALNKVLTRNYDVRNLIYAIPELEIDFVDQIPDSKLDYYSYLGEIDLNYQLGSRLHLNLTGFFSAPLSNVKLEEDLITTMTTYGVKGGLKYSF